MTTPEETFTHLMLLPAPLHAPETVCGMRIMEINEPGKHFLTSDVDRVTCRVCQSYAGKVKAEEIPNYIPKVLSAETSEEKGTIFSMSVPGQFMAAMVEQFGDYFDGVGATNFVEFTMMPDKKDRVFKIILQKEGAETPSNQRVRLKTELDRVNAALAAYTAAKTSEKRAMDSAFFQGNGLPPDVVLEVQETHEALLAIGHELLAKEAARG